MYEKYVTLRDENNMTDYKVSQITGIPKSTFSDWKSGKSKPKIPKIKKLANLFDVSVDYLIDEGGEAKIGQ